MFTAEQIKAAHSKVKSGADFPGYIKEIKALGVTHYEAYVSDGHIDYHGANNHTARVPEKYAPIPIADTAKIFIQALQNFIPLLPSFCANLHYGNNVVDCSFGIGGCNSLNRLFD